MNRAARRGNSKRVRSYSGATLVNLHEQHRSGLGGSVLLAVPKGGVQGRDASGRFSGLVVAPEPELTTRQQRRHAARQASKRSGA